MEITYTDKQIRIRVSSGTESIDRRYLEDFIGGIVTPVTNASGITVIGIDIQRNRVNED